MDYASRSRATACLERKRYGGAVNRASALVVSVVVLLSMSGCDARDSDEIPFLLTGMDAYLQVGETMEVYAGRVDANYLSRDDALDECRDLALVEARRRGIENWGYICCTVTSTTDCDTKVR